MKRSCTAAADVIPFQYGGFFHPQKSEGARFGHRSEGQKYRFCPPGISPVYTQSKQAVKQVKARGGVPLREDYWTL